MTKKKLSNYVEFDCERAKRTHPTVHFELSSTYRSDIDTFIPAKYRPNAVVAGGTFTKYTMESDFAKHCPKVVETLRAGHDTDIFIESDEEGVLQEIADYVIQAYPDVEDFVQSAFNLKFAHGQSLINIIVMDKPVLLIIEEFLFSGSRIYYSYVLDKVFCSEALYDTEIGNLESFLCDIANENDEYIIKSQETVNYYYYSGNLNQDNISRVAATYYLVKYIAKGFDCPRWREFLGVILARLTEELDSPEDSFIVKAFGEKIRILKSVRNSIQN